MRLAVEDLARSQQEAQALAAYLSAQQGRVEQTAERLDATRTYVAAATMRNDEIAANLQRLSDQLARTSSREERDNLERTIRQFRDEQIRAESDLQRARDRESELSRELQIEQTRWDDLVSDIGQFAQ